MREAGVMLIVRDGLILGISRRHDKTKFGLPGGKLEVGESPSDAAIRETLEETGVKVIDCTFIYKRVELGVDDGIDFFTYCYYANVWSGEPRSSEEGDVKWLTASQLTGGEHAAFPDYNSQTLSVFRDKFPHIELK